MPAVYACWRKRPALRFWLIGVAGHLAYVFVGDAVSSGVDLASMFTLDAPFDRLRIAFPGVAILMLDQPMIEAPG